MDPVLTCQWKECGKTFRSKDDTQLYCSRTCGNLARSARRASDEAVRAYVETRITKLPGPGACWQWTGFVTRDDYGRAFVRNKVLEAHILVYELYKGPVPAEAKLVRTCEMKPCVNPAHRRVIYPNDPAVLREFLLSRVEKDPHLDCWLWQGMTDGHSGYGLVRTHAGSRKKTRAHRAAYEMFTGPIPEGQDVLHRCNVKTCINPEHLYLGTDAENGHDRAVAQVMHRTPGLTDDMVLEMRKLRHDKGLQFAELQNIFGIPAATCRDICRGVVYKHLDMTYVDTSPGRTMKARVPLTADEERRIVMLRTQQGMSYRDIGKMYDVSGSRIMAICRRHGENPAAVQSA